MLSFCPAFAAEHRWLCLCDRAGKGLPPRRFPVARTRRSRKLPAGRERPLTLPESPTEAGGSAFVSPPVLSYLFYYSTQGRPPTRIAGRVPKIFSPPFRSQDDSPGKEYPVRQPNPELLQRKFRHASDPERSEGLPAAKTSQAKGRAGPDLLRLPEHFKHEKSALSRGLCAFA